MVSLYNNPIYRVVSLDRRRFKIGVGTGRFEGQEECSSVLSEALEIGYRFLDTAQQYEMEGAVDDAVSKADVSRSDIYISYNIHSRSLGRDSIQEVIRDAVSRMSFDYLDAASVHWPAHEYDPEETLDACLSLQEHGLIRDIGVSNFTRDLLAEALDYVDVEFNIFEFHPYFQPDELLEFCDDNGVVPVAHTPLAQGRITDDPAVTKIAEGRAATEGQVCLAWLLSKGAVPVPGSSGSHLRENYEATELSLSEKEIRELDELDRGLRLVDYDFAPWNT